MSKISSKYKRLSAIIALSLASSSALASDLGYANKFSALVFEEFEAKHGRADGPIAAGEISLKGYSVGYQRPSSPDEYYLISEEEIEFKSGRQYVGSMIAGGDVSGVKQSVANGMEQHAVIIGNASDDEQHSFVGNTIATNLPISFDEQEDFYENLSEELAKLSANGTAEFKWGGLYLKGDNQSQTQVFTIDAKQFAKAHTFKVRKVPADATIIFNIIGDEEKLVVKGKSFSSLKNHRNKTIFNFPEVEELDIKGNKWQGVVLAPDADIRAVHGDAMMPVIANSFYGAMTLHGGDFTGTIPAVDKPLESIAMEKKWHWQGGTFLPESNQVMIAPVVAQLNDDNEDGKIDNNDTADVVVVTFANNEYSKPGLVRALSGIDGSELWDYSNGGFYADPRMSPAVGDLDNDGFMEIVFTDRSDKVTVISHLGELEKQFTKSNTKHSNVTLSDINSDGVPEVMLANDVFDYDWGYKFSHSIQYWTFGTITFDHDLDGHQEVFSAGELSDSSGAYLWSHDTDTTVWFSAVANFDTDEYPEIVVSAPSSDPLKNKLALLEHDGTVIWEQSIATAVGGGVQAVSNFFDKDALGIVYAGFTSVDMYDGQGQVVWSVPNDDEWSGKIGVSAYDFNQDGKDEVLVQDHFSVRVLDGTTGKVLANIANSTASLWEYPIVVDLQGDDNAELIMVANDFDSRYSINHGVVVYGSADANMPWKNATRIWNQHSYHYSNVTQDGQIPQYEMPSWLSNNTYRSSTLPIAR